MEAINPGTATMGSFLHLVADFNSPERFDEFDVDGFRYYQNGDPAYGTTRMKPLIGGTDAHFDSWYLTWSKPVIYDYYTEAKKYTSLRFDRYTPDTIGIAPYKTFRFHPTTAKKPKLSASELRPNIYGINLNLGNMAMSESVGSSSSDMKFINSTPIWTYIDYTRLDEITNSISFMADWGSNADAAIPEPFKTLRKRYLDSNWTNPTHGEYSFRLNFNVPEPALRVNSTSGGISAVKGPAAPHQKYTY
jgi:hypothetical protein